MIWFLEKQDDLLVCEIRRNEDQSLYEFEISDANGPQTLRFDSAKQLIAGYLAAHTRLVADGWRPRADNVRSPE